MTRMGITRLVVMLAVIGATGPALAHVTPPVVLVSDRDAVLRLLAGARKFYVKEIRLSAAERRAVKARWGWEPEEDFYRFYLGRDEQGHLVSAAIFLTEYTVHGPVRVAVGLSPEGKVSGAAVVELSEESYPWLKMLIDRDFTREYVGHDSHESFALSHTVTVQLDAMARFYAQIVASLLQRGAILFEVSGVVLAREPFGIILASDTRTRTVSDLGLSRRSRLEAIHPA